MLNNTFLSTRKLIMGLWQYITPRRRVQLYLLLLVMLGSGVSELISLGTVLPFLSVFTDSDRPSSKPFIYLLRSHLGISTESQLVLAVTIIFAFTAILTALIRLANLWLNGRLAAAIGSDLSCEVYRKSLYQPYSFHLRHNSSELITSNTIHINLTVAALNTVLQLITSLLVSVGLITVLLIINASVAIAVSCLLGGAYWIFAITVRRKLLINGKIIANLSSLQLKSLQEGLGAIRDVLLGGCQTVYLEIYRQADFHHRKLEADNSFLRSFPRYALEALGIVAITAIGGILLLQRGNKTDVIPLLGVLALGAQRLLPALQQIYSGWASLKVYNAALQDVMTMLSMPLRPQPPSIEVMSMYDKISLENVYFSYGLGQPDVLSGLDLEVCRGERLGLIGATGSGKTTTVDLLMGLITPCSGRVMIDGRDLHDKEHPERLLAWQRVIAHVPQRIYLADRSIAENIAFGVPRGQINFDQVKFAAEQAQIANFIDSTTDRYETIVGEQGIRLSGGQRQRIGIARALYRNAHFLVLDEATSALDNDTEESVMRALDGLSKKITVVLIAHRLSTLSNCDRVIRLG